MMIVILLTSPFGWIAGQLSELNRIFPFVLNIGLFLIGMVLVWLAWRLRPQEQKTDASIAVAQA